MDGWQAVAALAIGEIAACILAMHGHENVAIALGVGTLNGVFALLTQIKQKISTNGHGTVSGDVGK